MCTWCCDVCDAVMCVRGAVMCVRGAVMCVRDAVMCVIADPGKVHVKNVHETHA